MSAANHPPGTRQRKRRYLVPVVVAALVAGLGTLLTPGTAGAQPSGPSDAASSRAAALAAKLVGRSVSRDGLTWNIPETSCAPLGDVVWTRVLSTAHLGYSYLVVSSVSTFNVSEAREVNNQLDKAVPATFTSTQTRSWSITTAYTFTTAQPLADKFTSTISTTIVQGISTAIGVSTTAEVPARTTVIADYGVEAYDVVYDARLVGFDSATGKCYDGGTTRAFANAPTYVEGWRLRYAAM